SDVEWMALNIYHEARGEVIKGMIGVALVTLNRADGKNFPDTIEGVVTQPDQFSWYWDEKSNKPKEDDMYKNCLILSKVILYLWESNIIDKITRHTMFDGVKWYHSNKVSPYWADDYQYVGIVDNHLFYK
ncbi:MAG: cell wall hydrolase, partial [Candidatus Peribacteraceae bacterium]|nr:cell wall hydrolase [Candidatus Peribacteraceae bacterium]